MSSVVSFPPSAIHSHERASAETTFAVEHDGGPWWVVQRLASSSWLIRRISCATEREARALARRLRSGEEPVPDGETLTASHEGLDDWGGAE
ncbi:hypothetical protein ABLE93_14805 [Xanthobacter sp. KR7-65]|uniref:hypothetical protein n=1 Tax=Xanthobacter sp. KR7-65 TaxID=3156612 RepID=UPI0032B4783F